MQKSYKGEMKELKDIQPGTPIEIVEGKELFRVNTGTVLNQLPMDNVVGVLTGFAQNYYNKTGLIPRVNVLDQEGNFLRCCTDRPLVPTQTFKVLTGKKAEALRQKVSDELGARLGNFLHKAPGFTTGCDPEMFVVRGDGGLIPAFQFLPSKKNRGDYNQPFWDGYQAEFTPASNSCWANGVDSVREGLRKLHDTAKKFDPTARLTVQNVFDIPQESLLSADLAHVELGCKPSCNAYGKSGEKVGESRDLPWRFAGGHVHLGFGRESEKQVVELVKSIDAIAGVACVGMFEGIDNPIRRRFYGLAGEYRMPLHGLEYRTLSNAWLSHPAVSHFVVDLVRGAAWMGSNGLRFYWNAEENEVQKVINECDVLGARRIVDKNAKLFYALVEWIYSHATLASGNKADSNMCAKAARIMVDKGIKEILKNYDDVAGNWMLDCPLWSEVKDRPMIKQELYANYAKRLQAWTDANRGKFWEAHSEAPDKQFHKVAAKIVAGEPIA